MARPSRPKPLASWPARGSWSTGVLSLYILFFASFPNRLGTHLRRVFYPFDKTFLHPIEMFVS